ncbi:MAG: hypothetical protein GY838_16865 [bacterium]|nr:hypothetical protein [bacterium]
MATNRLTDPIADVRDRWLVLVLLMIALAVRLPFWRTFDLVTYDGTYYLAQARSLLTGETLPSGFPLGYPLPVGLLDLVCGDLVTAAQLVSLLASLGAVACLFGLARHYVGKGLAALAALLLAVNPLFIQYSLTTMSEALGVASVLAGLLLFVKGRFLPCGLATGLAAVTRPELALVAVVLALSRLRRWSVFVSIVLGFAAVYALNATVLSVSAGRPVLLNKTANFMLGRNVQHTLITDDRIDDVERDARRDAELAKKPANDPVVYYFKRLPTDLGLLLRHTLPAVLLLAAVGLWRTRSLVLAAPLFFLPFMPLFAPRSEPRFILPYIPALLVLAVAGAASLGRRLRLASVALLALTAVAWPVIDRTSLAESHDAPLVHSGRDMAQGLGDALGHGDRLADRKPYLAFHAGADFVLLPAAPYEATLRFLDDQDCGYLALRRRTVRHRPALRPLLDDPAVLLGETRLRVLVATNEGDVILKVEPAADRPAWRKVTIPGATSSFPAWSAEGRRVTFVVTDDRGQRLLGGYDLDTDQLFAPAQARHLDGRTALSPDGRWLALVSDRTGRDEIWLESTETGEQIQLTADGGSGYPAFSPDSRRLAWTRSGAGVVIRDLESGGATQLEEPRTVHFAPAWSPDGRHLAVTAADWGSWDIYLVRADGGGALLLTRMPGEEGMPSWSPDGDALAIISDRDGAKNVWLLEGLGLHLERLADPRAYMID